MDKFTQLCAGCKNSVEIRVNDHRDVYQSVEDYFNEQLAHGGTQGKEKMDDVVDPDVYKKCVETNNIVYVHFYPRSATTFFSFYHYDVDLALDEALKLLEEYTKEYDGQRN